jgi:hypothetical protein
MASPEHRYDTQIADRAADSALVRLQNAEPGIRVLVGRHVLLEGSRRDPVPVLCFTEGSGVQAGFNLTGSLDPSLDLSGAGPLRLGTLAFASAAVHATPGSIRIAAQIPWASDAPTVVFEPETEPGCWRGTLVTDEVLPCLMTRRDTLHVTVNLQVTPASTTYSAFAVVEGRHVHISAASTHSPDAPHDIRNAILAVVRKSLTQELEITEQKYFAALNENDRREESAEKRNRGAPFRSHSIAPQSLPSRGSSTLAGGYLPAQVAQSRGADPPRGYLPQRPQVRTPAEMPAVRGRDHNPGYLPAVHPKAPAAGYLPSALSRKTRSAPTIVPGYLPARHSSAAATSVPEPAQDKESSDSGCLEAQQFKLAEYERIAYAVLRCKDLLQAIDALSEVSK